MNTKQQPSNAWGIASFVTALLSVIGFLMPYFCLPLAIFSLIAYGIQVRSHTTGFATAGLIIGIIGVLLNIATGMLVLYVLSAL